ncbi:uncharacterized protein LTHEOB_2980 [Lasiodiplodia theobromae]|uniref:uncharacterized protein n=1 Tax=Lasiodiplodia theobromae TaxID=45133 RepID=UPI0015C3549A|nr:uncharacterized protein LTHEOB_2980 [Lasiodiplodia theobromae]KAF4535005.1 hypothetical protein LTHEOB_2980 [Lasiodiplodia theobromae]
MTRITMAALFTTHYQERYGPKSQPPDSSVTLPPALDLILRHKSIRKFLPDALPPATLELLIAAGQSAPTSSMLQAWSVIAIEDPARKDTVATLAGDQDFIRQAPLFLAFCADLARLTAISEQRGQPGKGLENMDLFVMATIDAALAAQNVVVAAESLGLGTCYVGAARNRARELSALLDLPKRVVVLFGLAVGKPDPECLPAIKQRLGMDEVLHREKWNHEGHAERVAEYDETLGNFYEKMGVTGRSAWSEFTAMWLASGDLDGREELKDVLMERGFELK